MGALGPKKVAMYTGLSPDYVEQSNLRINLYRFLKELSRENYLTIGALYKTRMLTVLFR